MSEKIAIVMVLILIISLGFIAGCIINDGYSSEEVAWYKYDRLTEEQYRCVDYFIEEKMADGKITNKEFRYIEVERNKIQDLPKLNTHKRELRKIIYGCN